jgi:hypothetical protein
LTVCFFCFFCFFCLAQVFLSMRTMQILFSIIFIVLVLLNGFVLFTTIAQCPSCDIIFRMWIAFSCSVCATFVMEMLLSLICASKTNNMNSHSQYNRSSFVYISILKNPISFICLIVVLLSEAIYLIFTLETLPFVLDLIRIFLHIVSFFLLRVIGSLLFQPNPAIYPLQIHTLQHYPSMTVDQTSPISVNSSNHRSIAVNGL